MFPFELQDRAVEKFGTGWCLQPLCFTSSQAAPLYFHVYPPNEWRELTSGALGKFAPEMMSSAVKGAAPVGAIFKLAIEDHYPKDN